MSAAAPLSRAGERIRTLPQRHGRATLVILALIVAVGFGLRFERVLNPLEHPGDDARAYFSLAKSLYEDGTYGGPSFRDADDWSPGAPLMYAGVYYLTGGVRDGAARLLLALLGTAAIVIVYLLGRRINCRPAGLLAAAGVALYPPFIHSNGALLSEPPALFFLPAAVLAFLWAADRNSRAPPPLLSRPGAAWAWTLPGVLFGITALIRPEYLFVGAAFAIVALILVGRRSGWRPGMGAGALLALAFVLPLVPWMVRNLIVLDRFVPVSTGGGKALYVGTYLPADGDYQRVKALLVERYQGRELEPGSRELERVAPTPLFDRVAARYPDLERDQALSRIGKDQLFDYLEEDPLDYGAMLARKVGRMWSSGVGEAMSTTTGKIVQLCLVALGLVGLALLAMRRRLEALVMALPIAMITAIGAITLASNRRNEVLMTLVFPLAGVALARAGSILRARRRARRGPGLAAHGGAQA
jgi:Dolichyl-phosphate-mannose-protein mannosyltransferase